MMFNVLEGFQRYHQHYDVEEGASARHDVSRDEAL
jgi:hypothetical protein